MLSMMISGPRQPGNDIYVYLSLLIEDLTKLWDKGVLVFDGFRKKTFQMRAMIFCTINDFPAYGNLSGYNVKDIFEQVQPIDDEGNLPVGENSSLLQRILDTFDGLQTYVGERFDALELQVDMRFDEMDSRITKVEGDVTYIRTCFDLPPPPPPPSS